MSEDLRASRRIVFSGLGALGVATALAGCGGGSSKAGDGPTTSGSTSGGGSGETLVAVADVPIGGGVVLTDKNLVVTQPTKGEFEAFSATCKHQGFPVGKVEDGTITCLVHGSTYDAATGKRKGGPAPAGSALDKVEIKVDGDRIVTA